MAPEYYELNAKIVDGSTVDAPLNLSADVVIVGSGAGGATMAKELAEAGMEVVLLEEGRYYDHRNYPRSALEAFMQLYREQGATASLGKPPISMPVGRTVGGTTTINSGTCFRTPDHVMLRWSVLQQLPDLDPTSMGPLFERVEKIIHAHELPREVWGNNALVVERGAKQLGLTVKPLVHNNENCRGCGTCAIGCPDGAKRAANTTYVPLCIKAGGKVVSSARVEQIEIANGRAVGVSGSLLSEDGLEVRGELRVRAPLVIIACGTLHTPVLLKRNKLGKQSGQLGRNLTVHPAVRVLAVMDEEVKSWIGVPQGTYIDDFKSDGIMFEGIAVPPALGAPVLPYIGQQYKELMGNYANVSTYGVMISDTATGRVLNSRNRPLSLYKMSRQDVRRVLRGVGVLARIYFAAGAKSVYTGVAGLPQIKPDQVRLFERTDPDPMRLESMAFHPLGTARIGVSREESVSDPYGELWDVKGLFAVDGGMVPSSLGVNPMVTIMALATRSAQYIAAQRAKWISS
ncbi:MAG: GMC family oxidoreductase [Candidatus Alcyoniella australis]|nr:GMC family oxidoreductase [Candidatus Alcyoniella australis]